jgi:hypothetical protein
MGRGRGTGAFKEKRNSYLIHFNMEADMETNTKKPK